MKFFGIQSRIMLSAIIPTALLAILLGYYFIDSRITEARETLLESGNAIARYIASGAEYSIYTGNRDVLVQLAQRALSDPKISRITITDRYGKVLFEQGKDKEHPLPEDERINIQTPIQPPEIKFQDYPGATESNPDTGVLGYIQIELSMQPLLDTEDEILINGLFFTLIILAATTLLAARLSQAIAQPITHLISTVQQLGSGNLSVRAREVTTGELGALQQGINAMAETLESVQRDLEQQIELATSELRSTLQRLENQNVELEKARQAALQAAKDKSEFLANMSHEIRTPLNGMLGFIDLLLHTPLSGEQREYITTVRKSANNLLVIVNDILDFSKIESGKLQIEHSPFDLREALEDSVDLMAPLAHTKGLEFVLLIYADVPLHLYGDSTRIRQILLNLIGNAIKFTQQGNVVVRVMLDEETGVGTDEASIRIQVSDTGKGLTQNEQNRLFGAFFQADTSPTRRHGGTGLGLFISKRLVELMGGDIGVNSLPGHGATFWFRLTLKTQEKPPRTDILPQTASGHALVCDPSPLARLALCHPLESWGIEVIEADNIQGIVEILDNENSPRLDFITLGVPPSSDNRMNIERMLGTLKPYRIPILLLINTIEKERLQEGLTLGAGICLTKPTRRESLRLAVWKLMDWPETRPAGMTERRKHPRPQPPRLEGGHILIADDNEINRRLTELQLKALGITVDEAEDGAQALELALQHHYDLIFLDIHMPNMTGIQAAEAIRKNPDNPNRDTPIIALTADALVNLEPDTSMNSLVQEILIKPVNEYRIWEAIRRWTDIEYSPDSEAMTAGRDRVAEVKQELLERFRGEVDDWKRTMNQSLADRDWQSLRGLAHKLKGSAMYCGADALAEAGRRLESACRGGDADQIRETLTHCIEELDAFKRQGARPE